MAEHKLCTPNPMVYHHIPSKCSPLKGSETKTGTQVGPFQPGQGLWNSSTSLPLATCHSSQWQVARGREVELFHRLQERSGSLR